MWQYDYIKAELMLSYAFHYWCVCVLMYILCFLLFTDIKTDLQRKFSELVGWRSTTDFREKHTASPVAPVCLQLLSLWSLDLTLFTVFTVHRGLSKCVYKMIFVSLCWCLSGAFKWKGDLGWYGLHGPDHMLKDMRASAEMHCVK